MAECIATIRNETERVGREPRSVRVRFNAQVEFDATDGRPFSGPPDAIADQLRRYLEVGVDSLLISFGRRSPADHERCQRLFAERVWPAIGARVGA